MAGNFWLGAKFLPILPHALIGKKFYLEFCLIYGEILPIKNLSAIQHNKSTPCLLSFC